MGEAVFDTPVIASIVSGKLICLTFSEVHGAIERLAGGPVWTHQIPRVCDELRPHIERLCPQIVAFDYSGVSPETVDAERTRLVNECGAVVTLTFPLLTGHEPDPFRDLPENALIVGLEPQP